MFLKVSALKNLDVKILKDGNLVYEGNVDQAPDEYKDCYYNKIYGAYPVIVEI